MDYGEKTFEEMLFQIRQKAKHDLEEAQQILNAKDEDFEVNIVRGKLIQHHIRSVSPNP